MSEQQAEEMLKLLRQIADDMAVLKGQGEVIAKHAQQSARAVARWNTDGFPPTRVIS